MPNLPKKLAGLRDIAYNLWWSWDPQAQALFEELNPQTWKAVRNNPVKALLEASTDRLEALSENAGYIGAVEAALTNFRRYLETRPKKTPSIGYFSMEFGFHESLPIYSGGLGILAGDHIKSASDLGLDLTGVGLFYHEGYFRQQLTAEGQQIEVYDAALAEELPLTPVLEADGKPIRVSVDFPGRKVFITAYKAQVGTIPVYLMSTNVPENSPADRWFTARLYAPGQEIRLQQEIILGIGGVRLLRALGIKPQVWHMNEGHAAFLGLERMVENVESGMGFGEAVERASAGALFTTHTPVPAGHDTFPLDLISSYMGEWWNRLKISKDDFLNLGRETKSFGDVFSMSNLALLTSRAAGGVSKLHGQVSREMFHERWEGLEVEEIPIGHITNGVHVFSFLSPDLLNLYTGTFPKTWRENVFDQSEWRVDALEETELWRIRNKLRGQMVNEVRTRLYEQRRRNGDLPAQVRRSEKVLDPTVLTIGFARRFATYKRAMLLMSDPERLKQILDGPLPVQFVFAGKAHPKDDPGKDFLKKMTQTIKSLGLEDKMVVLENYDIGMARTLVQGVDVWLNTPRRPMEASGTSGMKAALNGVLNFSILDGWWPEAFNTTNGWAIGDERSFYSGDFVSEDAEDQANAQSLYDTLQHEIIPLFYARGSVGTPSGWLAMVRDSIRSCGPMYSAHRMVDDYHHKFYTPLANRAAKVESGAIVAKDISSWKDSVRKGWGGVQISVLPPIRVEDGSLEIAAKINSGSIAQENLLAELVIRRSTGDLEVIPLKQKSTEGGVTTFGGTYKPDRPGSYVYGVRAVAVHPNLSSPKEVAFSKWA